MRGSLAQQCARLLPFLADGQAPGGEHVQPAQGVFRVLLAVRRRVAPLQAAAQVQEHGAHLPHERRAVAREGLLLARRLGRELAILPRQGRKRVRLGAPAGEAAEPRVPVRRGLGGLLRLRLARKGALHGGAERVIFRAGRLRVQVLRRPQELPRKEPRPLAQDLRIALSLGGVRVKIGDEDLPPGAQLLPQLRAEGGKVPVLARRRGRELVQRVDGKAHGLDGVAAQLLPLGAQGGEGSPAGLGVRRLRGTRAQQAVGRRAQRRVFRAVFAGTEVPRRDQQLPLRRGGLPLPLRKGRVFVLYAGKERRPARAQALPELRAEGGQVLRLARAPLGKAVQRLHRKAQRGGARLVRLLPPRAQRGQAVRVRIRALDQPEDRVAHRVKRGRAPPLVQGRGGLQHLPGKAARALHRRGIGRVLRGK